MDEIERSKHDSTPPQFLPKPDAERERLLADLEHYLNAFAEEIRSRVAAWIAAHATSRAPTPNALMVPSGFHSVAHGATFMCMAIITPALAEDFALDLPYICYTILPS